MSAMLELAALNEMNEAAFVGALGGVYEKSPWIAERAFRNKGEIVSITALAEVMKREVDAASEAEQLDLITSHPDLAGKAALAGELTAESTNEQARAGLGSLTPEEMERFTRLNGKYREKFGFPFILAVRNASKHIILGAFETRLHNSRLHNSRRCTRSPGCASACSCATRHVESSRATCSTRRAARRPHTCA